MRVQARPNSWGAKVRRSLSSVVLGAALLTPAAHAHIGAPEGRGLFFDLEGNVIGAGTTWGVLERTNEGFLRTCEESVGDTVHFYYWARDREEVLVGTNSGILASSDHGCSWTPSGMDNQTTTIMRTPRDQPGVLFVATTTNGEANGVYRSIDDGATWATTALSREEFAFTSLQVSEDGQTVVATGIDYTVTAPRVFLSSDGGATFDEVIPFPEQNNISFINAIGITADTIALSVLRSGEQGSTLYRASLDLQTLDACTAFNTGEANGVLTDYALFEDTEYVLVNRSLMHKRGPGDTDFIFEDAGPGRCLLLPRESDRFWGCAQPFQLGHFLSVDSPDASLEPIIPYLEVYERRCPVGTIGEERCRYLFAPGTDAGPAIDGGTPGPEVPEPSPSPDVEPDAGLQSEPPVGGCESTPGAGVPPLSLGAVLLGLFWGWRRRRMGPGTR